MMKPPRTRILQHQPVAIDRVVNNVLLPPPDGRRLSKPRRAVRDLLHFGVSVASELACVVGAAPGFLNELVRQGVYPDRMQYRKLPYRPEMADLAVLREWNPQWTFRADFDPKRWVFVFLHGYVDNTGADRIAFKLASLGYQVYLVRYPFLRAVADLAEELTAVIEQIADLEPGKRLIPVGHSLGGCIWDHVLLHRPEVVDRYQIPLYLPLGSPHFGTLAAHIGIGKSAADMRLRSALVTEHLQLDFPAQLEMYPFVSRFDLLVLPIETALLKRGINYVLSETGHVGQVIRSNIVTAIEEIIASPPELLEQRAQVRPFYPSALARALSRLPRSMQQQLGVAGILDYIGKGGDGDPTEPPVFKIRVLHHELGLGVFPALRRPS